MNSNKAPGATDEMKITARKSWNIFRFVFWLHQCVTESGRRNHVDAIAVWRADKHAACVRLPSMGCYVHIWLVYWDLRAVGRPCRSISLVPTSLRFYCLAFSLSRSLSLCLFVLSLFLTLSCSSEIFWYIRVSCACMCRGMLCHSIHATVGHTE